MPITLNDAFYCHLIRVSGEVVTPGVASYMSRKQCEAWLKANACPGDKVEIVRTMTNEIVHTEVVK